MYGVRSTLYCTCVFCTPYSVVTYYTVPCTVVTPRPGPFHPEPKPINRESGRDTFAQSTQQMRAFDSGVIAGRERRRFTRTRTEPNTKYGVRSTEYRVSFARKPRRTNQSLEQNDHGTGHLGVYAILRTWW